MSAFEVTERDDVTEVHFGSVLDMTAAQPLQEALQAAVAKGSPLIIDASSVERLSTACIQLLIAAEAAMKSAAIDFTLSEPSEVFTESFKALGLDSILAQWNTAQ